MVHVDIVVAVPRLPLAVPDLHEPHAPLDQPPGDENLPGLHARAVHVADVLRLAADVERVGRFDLHAIGQLERLHAGFELRIAAALLLVQPVERLHEVELPPLLGRRANNCFACARPAFRYRRAWLLMYVP